MLPGLHVGNKYNKLTVRHITRKKGNDYYCLCDCDCGNTKEIRLSSVVRGETRSCGCLKKGGNSHLNKYIVDGTNINNLKRGIQANNKTGVKGVCFDKSHNKYHAYIGLGGKQMKLGYFDTIEEAARERKRAEIKYHEPILEKMRD